jgi:hypothetical protein
MTTRSIKFCCAAGKMRSKFYSTKKMSFKASIFPSTCTLT